MLCNGFLVKGKFGQAVEQLQRCYEVAVGLGQYWES